MFPKAWCDLWGIQISILKPPQKDSSLQLVAVTEIFSKMVIDEAVKFTSEMHDPCARTVTYKREENKNTFTEGTGVEPAKHPLKVKSEVFSQL